MANNREKVLLAVFVGALVIVGGVFAWNALGRDLQVRKALLATKDEQLAELQRWVDEKPVWQSREQWMDKHPVPAYHNQQSEAEFVRAMQASFSKHGIIVVEQRIQETRADGPFVETPVDLVLDSTLEQLVRWLYDVQRPENFRGMDRIRMRSSADSTKIRTELSIYQIFDNANTVSVNTP